VPDSKPPKLEVRTSRKTRARRRGTILIADTADAIAALTHTLDGDDVRFVTGTTLSAARKHLKSSLRLILCGVHFDGGRMFEFLKLAKATPATAAVPFVCVRALSVLAKPLVPHGIEVAARELGAVAYVDHLHTQNTIGQARAAKSLRQILIAACRS
jgi:hypothetical protein